MKKIFVAALAVAALAGCGQIDNSVNSFKSATGMLHRTVTLYAADGRVLKQWNTTNQIEYSGALAAFVDDQGVNVRVAGTFTVEGR